MLAVPSQWPSPAQVAAVRAVMQILVDDDLARGKAAIVLANCSGCRRSRPAAGAVTYGSTTLCNRCATEFELARLNRSVQTVSEFVAELRSDRCG